MKEVLNEDEWAAIKDNGMMNKTLLTLAGTIILFSLHELVLSPRGIHIEISAIALGGAGIAMMLSLPDVHHVIEKVEWTALLFFAGLFTMVGALEHMGHLENIAKWIFAKFGPDGSISPQCRSDLKMIIAHLKHLKSIKSQFSNFDISTGNVTILFTEHFFSLKCDQVQITCLKH